MNKSIAKLLAQELGRQFTNIKVNVDYFNKFLISEHIEKSSRFSESLPENKQDIPENSAEYHQIVLKRILRNENARNYSLNSITKSIEALKSHLGFSNSITLTRNLRTKNEGLVRLMQMHSKISPFSLLAEFQTFNHDNEKHIMFYR